MVEMFKCQLCGHRRTVEGWNPMLLSDGIVVQEVHGAGRGRGFVTTGEYDAINSFSGLDLLAMARRSLRIVEICLRNTSVFASDLVDNVPWQLQGEIVREKAEDYGYREAD